MGLCNWMGQKTCKNEGACNIKGSSNHFIDFEVENDQVGCWRYTGFYGCPERSRHEESWEMLRDLANNSELPWCIIGDFNDLMFADEKRGEEGLILVVA